MGFCCVVLAQLYQGAMHLEQNTARLDNEIGYRLEVWGFADICASTLYTLRFIAHHLYALISLPARGSVLTQMPQADVGAVRSSAGQNR